MKNLVKDSSKRVMFFKTREDFDQLNNLPFNRKACFRKDLAEKINKFGFEGAIILIYTNLFGVDGKKRLYIADGQHREITAKELGVEVIGIVVEYDFKSIEEIVKFVASLNSTQKEWTPLNYIETYQYLNYPDYRTLVELKLSCTFTFSAVALMLHGFRSKGAVAKHIEQGTFKCNFLEETKYTLRLAHKLSKYGSLTSRMVLALHGVSSLKTFDEAKFTNAYIANVKQVKELKLDDYSDVFADWLK